MHYHKLLIWQYRHKPKALATIKLFEQEIAQGFVDLSRLPEVMDIETATGANLDLVGKHVGQPRVINGYQLRKFLAFVVRLWQCRLNDDGKGADSGTASVTR